ncbi:unnamed protein product [Tuber melanosporum]|uniref:(Perigord truffle) hypothetical protein n=1 Tax=Tuber melanosporum (strain Mel28) TaxID=656061 RepID=D5GE08_TUBMM|nr:uncharacterized protein GSTUM_00001136001 [Tuber melanosporum]CAZ82751.1 unnamed protein product [Tuber melanosporum]
MSDTPSQERGESFDSPQSYKIHVASKYLDLTTQKFDTARLPNDFGQPEGEEWADGTPKRVIEELIDHWQERFDWRKQEAQLNRLPNFRVPIEVDGFGTLRIHFLWRRSLRPDAIPVIMVHGWPGSFWEFSKMIEPLANPPDMGMPAFNVVVPSLPGYAFSDGPKKPGFGAKKMAEAMDKLMKKLGYEHYVAQGGDWGCLICRFLALQYPQNVRAIHVNFLHVKPPTLFSHPVKCLKLSLAMASNGRFPGAYTPEEVAGWKRTKKFYTEEIGYQAIHGTKPMTLAYGLTDSPVGLLAWMREKMHSWTDNYPWTNDEVLTWFMLYWTPGPHQGTRLYKEASREIEEGTSKWSNVPMGFSSFVKEIVMPPSDWASMLHPLKFYRKHNSGGHFAAWEKPQELTNDVRDFFKGIVGKDKVLQLQIQQQHSVTGSNGTTGVTVSMCTPAGATNGV